ncbi:MAG TPA: helicase, partial [Nannocystis exedens]|nr:helicase [Nannocystis exedens]
MLGHRSGMIGLPLRLLAREVYDCMTAEVGEEAVALVTGEEKRVPERPRYWVCTTESMPMDREVDFVVVDEIQLAADRQRGHVFTDRLLRARGVLETWFLGAQTVAPLIRELLPDVRIDSRERLSELRYVGESTLSALPPRSAIVAFSAATVYELAERLRRRRGGAAVVLGALSPRTRNAQVAIYQAGEVDYLVATDAIGMGLNMDVDHVAFASTSKYDGRELRPLERDELAQIAGRAGRYQRDGSFGVLSQVAGLPHSVVRAIERHRFAPLSYVVWRNSDLDLGSPAALIASLRARSPRPELRRVERADDFDALTQLTADPQILRRASGPSMTRLLWDVCRIPDFRGLLLDSHIRFLARIFAQLSSPPGRLHGDWMARRIARLDDTEGDIATLMSRIAFIRTWTYIAHHPDWVADASHWQERTAAIENSLSDALHERLTERFVRRRERTRSIPAAAVTIDASSPFRCLVGLDLPDPRAEHSDARVEHEATFVERVVASSQAQIEGRGGVITFEGRRLACLRRGKDLLHPELVLTVDQELGAGARSRIHRRLRAWLRDQVAAV